KDVDEIAVGVEDLADPGCLDPSCQCGVPCSADRLFPVLPGRLKGVHPLQQVVNGDLDVEREKFQLFFQLGERFGRLECRAGMSTVLGGNDQLPDPPGQVPKVIAVEGVECDPVPHCYACA